MFDFQKLLIYQKSKQFHRNAKTVISRNSFNRSINDQLFRASLSIVLNIAEGSGRFSKLDRRRFYVIARGSVFECIAIYDILHDERSIDEAAFLSLQAEGEELSRILYSLIKSLSRE